MTFCKNEKPQPPPYLLYPKLKVLSVLFIIVFFNSLNSEFVNQYSRAELSTKILIIISSPLSFPLTEPEP